MKLNYFQITAIDLQWLKLFLSFFFIPYYKWIGEISACVYCNFGLFGYWNGYIAPYGILWYIFYWGITRLGYTLFIFFLWIFDSAVFTLVLSFQSHLYTFFFVTSSIFFFVVQPGDLFAFWLAVLGKEAPIMTILSVITKLPWPAPVYVWSFIFNVPLSSPSLQFIRYSVLGLWILHPSFYWIRSKL